MSYKLSILDKCPIPDDEDATGALELAAELAKLAEQRGYHRYWLAEHHNSSALASPSPELMIAWLISQTSTIRIGSGGVMLQHYSPYKVAENFNLLASLAPGRIDLGIGKAPGGLPLATRALQSGINQKDKGDFNAQLNLLKQWISDATPQNIPELAATPIPRQPAECFLLGASAESALLAAKLNWNFVYAAHINGDEQLMAQALLAFMEQSAGKKPLVALQVIAADTEEEAALLAEGLCIYFVKVPDEPGVNVSSRELAERYVQQSGKKDFTIEKRMPSLIYGTAEKIHQVLKNLHEKYKVDEFIIDTPVANKIPRFKSIELLSNFNNEKAK